MTHLQIQGPASADAAILKSTVFPRAVTDAAELQQLIVNGCDLIHNAPGTAELLWQSLMRSTERSVEARAHTHTHTHARTHARTYARTHARAHTHTRAHAHTHTHLYFIWYFSITYTLNAVSHIWETHYVPVLHEIFTSCYLSDQLFHFEEIYFPCETLRLSK
jgi:hypothetical protein